jgi:hypothetical protein
MRSEQYKLQEPNRPLIGLKFVMKLNIINYERSITIFLYLLNICFFCMCDAGWGWGEDVCTPHGYGKGAL